MSFNLGLSDTLVMIRQGWRVLGRKTTVAFSYYVKGICYLTWLITNGVRLNQMAQAVFVRLLYGKITVCPPFPTVFFGGKSLCSPRIRGGELCFTFWGWSIYINCWESCVRDLPISSLFITYPVTNVHQYGFMDVNFILL